MGILTDEMKRAVTELQLCYAATVELFVSQSVRLNAAGVGVTMSEYGEIGGAGWRILIGWNSITKPVTGLSRHATRGSTDASSSLSGRQEYIADRSVRPARRNAKTLRSSPQPAPLRRPVIGRAYDAVLKARRISAPGAAPRTPFHEH